MTLVTFTFLGAWVFDPGCAEPARTVADFGAADKNESLGDAMKSRPAVIGVTLRLCNCILDEQILNKSA